jgi:molybdenum cofactor cytidylyltransferase
LGFSRIALEPANAPQSRSLALGIAAARAAGAQAVLIALADMPLVPIGHFEQLIAEFDGTSIGTAVSGTAMPPAIFGEGLFDTLTLLGGDQGAKGLLGSAPLVELDPQLALDVDLPEDLAEAARRLD